MTMIKITAGDFVFKAVTTPDKAPKTVEAFLKRLPWETRIIHVRWSGEAVWMPLGDMDFGVGYEDATSHPAPGEMILYPGGVSETEILLAYGACAFASKAGQLAGNPFLRIVEGAERLRELGVETLWKGAKTIRFEKA